MKDEELDRILCSDVGEIEPSSGFAASVMEAVRGDAETPPPIPFPWVRAVPGFLAVVAALVLVVVLASRVGVAGLAMTWSAEMVRAVTIAGWVLGSLVVAFVSVRVCWGRG